MKSIIEILDYYNVEYRTSGKNVSQGKTLVVNCPFCGDDVGFHMGIRLDGSAYGCWRNSLHRGKNVGRVLQKLLGISYEIINSLLGKSDVVEDNEIVKLRDKLSFTNIIKKTESKKLELLPEFKDIYNKGITKKFYDYLLDRGFEDVDNLIKKYNLKCCLLGKYEYRIIIPIYFKNQLVTWTSRTIRDDEKVRYITLSEESILKTSDLLFNYDFIIRGGNTLFITEGPFDSIKTQEYLPRFYNSTCLFTKHITPAQISLFYELKDKYDKYVILLDRGEEKASIELLQRLEFIKNIKIKRLSKDIKDPGELTREQVQILINI